MRWKSGQTTYYIHNTCEIKKFCLTMTSPTPDLRHHLTQSEQFLVKLGFVKVRIKLETVNDGLNFTEVSINNK